MNKKELDLTPLPLKIEVKENARKLFNEISFDTEILIHDLRTSLASGIVYNIPLRGVNMPLASQIPVKSYTSNEDLLANLNIYSQFEREYWQHQNATKRLPGILYVKDIELIAEQVQQINALKINLKNELSQIPSSQRSLFIAKTFPSKIMLQAYRKIFVLNEQFERAVFTWVKTTSNKKTSVNEMMNRVLEDYDRLIYKGESPDSSINNERWKEILETEYQSLSLLKEDTQLRVIKKIAPHPRVVFYRKGEKSPAYTFHANTPIILSEQSNMKIRGLPSFKDIRPHKSRKDKLSYDKISSRLNLFSIKESQGHV